MSAEEPPWENAPLGKIAAEMCLGKMLDRQKNQGSLHPYLRNVNVRWFSFDLVDLKEMRFKPGEEIRFGLEPGDLVICEGGEPGRAAVWNGQSTEARIQKALHRVRFRDDEYDSRFAMYYLYYGTITNRFRPHYTGSTIKHLTGKALSQVEFPIPPLGEQRRIVAKIEELFSDLDAGVAALERARGNLRRYRAAVLKAAVEGRLTTQWRAEHPATEPAPTLLTRLLTERRERWEADQLAKYEAKGQQPPKGWREKYKPPVEPNTADLPELPEGWCWVTVDQLLIEDCCNGISVRGSDTPPGVKALRLSAMDQRGFDYSDHRFIPIDDRTTAALAIRAGDFFVARGNGSLHLVGRGTLAQDPDGVVVFPDTMIRLRLASVCRRFVSVAWQSQQLREQVEAAARTSAGIYKISQGDIRGFHIPLPPIEEQVAIVEIAALVESNSDAAESAVAVSTRRATRLRQSILKRAFEGRLVPQDPTDEPAPALLARIAAKRERAVAKRPARSKNGEGNRSKSSKGAKKP